MRSARRHHRERLKAKRRFQWGRDLRLEPVALAQVVDTPTPCSCALCSPRKRGDPSIKELAANEAWRRIERA
jgi:hypothetical protein